MQVVCSGGNIQAWMMFFADTGTLPPPFNLIPNPGVLYNVGEWLVYRVKGRRDVQARCSTYRCCYLERSNASATRDEDEYQKLMSTLIQRYFLAMEDAKKESNKNELGSTKGWFFAAVQLYTEFSRFI